MHLFDLRTLLFEVYVFRIRIPLNDIENFHGPPPTLVNLLAFKNDSVEIDFALFVFGADEFLDEVVALELAHGFLPQILLVENPGLRLLVVFALALGPRRLILLILSLHHLPVD